MKRPFIYLIVTLFLSLFFISTLLATTTHQRLNFLLSNYNVSAQMINQSTYINTTYGKNNYTIVYEGNTPYFLINTSSSEYTFVLNSSIISSIINNETFALLEKEISFNALSQGLTEYMDTSSSSLNDCLIETGLNRGVTCTLSNYCESCSLVPSCNKVLYATNGPSGVFGEGIMSFQQSYYALERNLSTFYFYSKNSNISNASESALIIDAQAVTSSYDNISKITQNLYQNPIFPPTQNANLAACNGFGSLTVNVSTNGGPWYCNAIGYCQFLSYNYSMLNNLNAMLNSINAQLPTQEKINIIANGIVTTENQFIVPILIKQKKSIYLNELNTTLSLYNTTVNDSTVLLTHIQNVTLSNKLSQLKSSYSNLENNYLILNVSLYSKNLSAELSYVNQLYQSLNKTYSNLLNKAQNNTVLLIGVQLMSPSSDSLSKYAFEENKINSQLSSSISNITSLNNSLTSISKNVSYANGPDISLQSLSRILDSPFVSFVSSALNLNYSETVLLVPIFSAILSLIIGLIILLILFGYYLKLKSSHKIKLNHNTLKAWHMLFILAIIIILIYVLLTYIIASSANSSASLSSFTSALSSSHSVIIVLNGTQTYQFSQCANQINYTAKEQGLNSKIYTISGTSCSPGLMNSSECMNTFARTNVPVISMSLENSSSINIYSMYGTVLSIKGSNSFLNECYGSYFVKQ
ncbi:MAG: hypothetical protein QXD23_02885 [Candidatus Micrarchaeaceae archaeon]